MTSIGLSILRVSIDPTNIRGGRWIRYPLPLADRIGAKLEGSGAKSEDAQPPGGWNFGKMSKRSSLAELSKDAISSPRPSSSSVRWYLGYKLSSRDISRLMAEREISVDHSAILRWVRRYAPEFEKEGHRYAHLIGPSWRVDETYVKVGGT
jgi:hypothetical protein